SIYYYNQSLNLNTSLQYNQTLSSIYYYNQSLNLNQSLQYNQTLKSIYYYNQTLAINGTSMNFSNLIVANGLNLGTATGATAGSINMSGNLTMGTGGLNLGTGTGATTGNINMSGSTFFMNNGGFSVQNYGPSLPNYTTGKSLHLGMLSLSGFSPSIGFNTFWNGTNGTFVKESNSYAYGIEWADNFLYINVHGNGTRGNSVREGARALVINGSGSINMTKDLNVQGSLTLLGGDLLGNNLRFGTTTSSGLYEFEDAGVCIGDGGCTASATDGRLIVEGTIGAGTTVDAAFNNFGSGQTPDSGAMLTSNDVFIQGNLEVEGLMYLTGGYAAIVSADIAEVLQTINARKHVLCLANSSCVARSYEPELEFGDVVCIDPLYGQVIKMCDKSNSQLVVGVVSNTSVINMGNNPKYGYPIAVAGIVYTKVITENGKIYPGDLLVSASKPGYATSNNNPRDGTVLGKAYDFCDKDECKILMFVALS
ncbi:MAG: hypothetical protein KKA64_02110, partial [Nanoarchaeota archaeon]|nr:hypothetical protein [Nanoarchaeota archaeon]